MFKQALTLLLISGFWLFSAFVHPETQETWTATLQLEGKGKTITLVSDAVYGGYNNVDKKYFLFGKIHMFSNAQDAQSAQIFRDLCVTNGAGQFQFELNGVATRKPGSAVSSYSGNILFKKKFPVSGSIRSKKTDKGSYNELSVSGDFKALGFQMTEEANQIMTGKFTLTFAAKP
jgi:hypothetical protein